MTRRKNHFGKLFTNISDKIQNYINHTFKVITTSPICFPTILAKLDSGASKSYIRRKGEQCLSDIEKTQPSLVGLLNKMMSKINQAGQLTLHRNLSKQGIPIYESFYIVTSMHF